MTSYITWLGRLLKWDDMGIIIKPFLDEIQMWCHMTTYIIWSGSFSNGMIWHHYKAFLMRFQYDGHMTPYITWLGRLLKLRAFFMHFRSSWITWLLHTDIILWQIHIRCMCLNRTMNRSEIYPLWFWVHILVQTHFATTMCNLWPICPGGYQWGNLKLHEKCLNLSNLPNQVIYGVMWPSYLNLIKKMLIMMSIYPIWETTWSDIYESCDHHFEISSRWFIMMPNHPIWVTYPIGNIWSHVTIRSEMSSKMFIWCPYIPFEQPTYKSCDHHIWNY